jgi:hypothetical protein
MPAVPVGRPLGRAAAPLGVEIASTAAWPASKTGHTPCTGRLYN